MIKGVKFDRWVNISMLVILYASDIVIIEDDDGTRSELSNAPLDTHISLNHKEQ